MKFLYKIFFFSLLLILANNVKAQYNNEWIDYSKTYYKFKLATTGLYRINASTLQSLGIGSTPGAQFQLWRNGKTVPIYISSSDETVALGSSDYIEFWGERNDGVPDSVLYKKNSSQLDKYYSLETDSASFFLTINTNTSRNNHYKKSTNTVPTGATPEAYCWAKWEYHGHDKINKGMANVIYGDPIYSSTYDLGEGWITNEINSGSTFSSPQIFGLPIYTSGPNPTITVGVVGTSKLGTGRTVSVLWNGTSLASQNIDSFYTGVFSIPITNASSIASGGNLQVTHNVSPSNSSDRIGVSYMTIDYPKAFDFGNSTTYGFRLNGKASNSYLSISNYSNNGFTPIIYDVTNGVRYAATINSNTLQYYLDGSSIDRNLIFVGQANQSTAVTTFTSKTFTDYKNNQGDYLIISGDALRAGGDPVEQYRSYRSSTSGGSYNAKIYDIDQLTDQFAFGIPMHPGAVKNFLRYVRANFSTSPKYVFLIGHGLTYDEYYPNQGSSNIRSLAIVPTFGEPASDVLLSSNDYNPVAVTPIGRISATTTTEVATYLSKIKELENTQQSTVQTIDNKAWMKNFVHIAGGNNQSESDTFIGYLNYTANQVKDTLIGGAVYDFNKKTNSGVASLNDALLRSLFKSGIGMINYWGHSSSTALDYNLDDPANYSNAGRYPIFFVSGCDVLAGCYTYDDARLSSLNTIPENYVFTPNAGSIAFVAQSYLGVTTFMNNFNMPFFASLGNTNYGEPITKSLIAGEKAVLAGAYPSNDTLSTMAQLEQNTLLGDPALKLSYAAKPDFAVEDASVIISPSYIDISKTKFHVKAYINNLGKATGDSLLVQVKHQHADGSSEVVYYKNIPSVRFRDSIECDIPIVSAKDKGQNSVIISLDPLNQYNELSKSNNTLSKTVNIYAIGLTPIYPYNYSIVNKQSIKLIASTANPIAATTQYAMEIDTTTLFNSSVKSRKTLSSFGGVLEFEPGISFQDSTVYYWRVAAIPTDGSDYHWNNSSFEYIAKSTLGGFNQSHVFQQFDIDGGSKLYLDSSSRNWNYYGIPNLFEVKIGVFGVSSGTRSEFNISVNTVSTADFHCIWGDGIVLNIFDPKTLNPYYNQSTPSTTLNNGEGGFMGSYGSNGCETSAAFSEVNTNFEFNIGSSNDRQTVSKFMDWIPDGSLVVVRMFPNYYNGSKRIPAWKTDPSSNSLYNHLVNAGFTNIDSSDYPKNWAFIYKKNTSSFKPVAVVTTGNTEQLGYTTTINTPDTLGYMTSPTFGPAKAWHEFKWKGYSLEKIGDNASVDIYGVSNAGVSSYIRTVPMTQESVDISNINTASYPYIKLIMRNADSINNTPYQLKYWQLTYDPVPEGALAANVYYKSDNDSLNKGTAYAMSIAFKNISETAFSDSIRVNYTLTDKNNVAHTISLPRLKPLAAGDTALIKVEVPGTGGTNSINTTTYTGNNAQYLDVNPDNDQLEYTHVNNFLSKQLYVNGDDGNASLDVTFDGLHILNNDIISSKPQIIAKLSSDSKSQLLLDTALLTLYLKYPDGTYKRFKYGTDTLLFTQAKDTSNNFALANFAPYLTQDGTYQLVIQGKTNTDATSASQYAVSFQVYNKPMISDMFNYPNPFTTSTAFVFTLTGSQVPQNLRIQILTITGKIVKEITKEELGTIRIGRNITDYKWDGTDQYGQKLANGVYIYRVITNLEGKKLDHFNISESTGNGGSTSQYFNKGYGKMYLMR